MRPPVGLSGGGLAEAFQNLRDTLDEDDERLDQILSLIDWVYDIGATESASSLLSPSVARGKNILKFTDRFMRKGRNTLTAYDASEGALYVLFAAVLCLSASAPRLFAVDNLDQALNPRLLARLTGRLSGWLASADVERQLVFTAHNPAMFRFSRNVTRTGLVLSRSEGARDEQAANEKALHGRAEGGHPEATLDG